MEMALPRLLFTPHAVLKKPHNVALIAVQIGIGLALWVLSPLKLMPTPFEVFGAYGRLLSQYGLLEALGKSLLTCAEAILLGSILSVGMSYLTVTPFFRAPVIFFTKMRFLSLTGLTLVFTVVTGGGHTLKLSVMVWGLSVFFATNVAAVVAAVTDEELDHARALGMGRWHVVYEVVVRGKLDEVLEALRQNAAITWMMLTLVEGLVRSEGGIGALLLIRAKYLDQGDVYAIQISILLVGMFIDYFLATVKDTACPWSELGNGGAS